MNAKPASSFREQYGPKSSAWTEGHFPPIVRFWTDDGSCWGVPFHQVIAVNYSPRAQTLLIHCSVGSILVTGSQAEAFLERFCEHKIALVKADGKDILRVSILILRIGSIKFNPDGTPRGWLYFWAVEPSLFRFTVCP